jgi:hypothetical protein
MVISLGPNAKLPCQVKFHLMKRTPVKSDIFVRKDVSIPLNARFVFSTAETFMYFCKKNSKHIVSR